MIPIWQYNDITSEGKLNVHVYVMILEILNEDNSTGLYVGYENPHYRHFIGEETVDSTSMDKVLGVQIR